MAKEGHHHDSVSNIKLVFFLNLFFTVIEIIGGILTNSIAIIADSLHDLGDSLSLGFSWFLEKYSKKKRTKNFSYGYRRFSLLGALINSIILLIGSAFVLKEAIPRLISPEPSNIFGMLILSILGIIVNGVAVLKLKKGQSLNEKIVSWHLLEDVLGWVAILIVSLVNIIKEIPILDPLLAIIFTLVIGFSILKSFKKVMMIFLQGTPSDLNVTDAENKIIGMKDIVSIHDTHIWTMDDEFHILTAHVVVKEDMSISKLKGIRRKVKDAMKDFNVGHSTIEIEIQGKS